MHMILKTIDKFNWINKIQILAELFAVLILIFDFIPRLLFLVDLSDISKIVVISFASISLIAFSIRLRGEKAEDFGLKLKKFRKEISIGFATYICLMASAYLIMFIFSFFLDVEMIYEEKNQTLLELFPKETLKFAILSFIPAVFFEELFFRAYLLRRLRQISGSIPIAILISSALFGLGHGYQNIVGIVTTLVWGVIFAVVYLWRRSIVSVCFAHLLNNILLLLALHYIIKN